MQTVFPAIVVPQYSAVFSWFGAFLPVRVFIFKCILTWLVPQIIPHVSPVHVPHLLPGIWFEMQGNGSARGRIQVLALLSGQNGPCSTFQVSAGDLKASPWTQTQNNQWHEFKSCFTQLTILSPVTSPWASSASEQAPALFTWTSPN